MSEVVEIRVHAMNRADDLWYRGQYAVSQAVNEREEFRIVGGHMVRLLLHVYPTAQVVPRSTLDADAAIGNVEVVGPVVHSLMKQKFTKEKGNLFSRTLEGGERVEINLLLPRSGPAPGVRSQAVPGVGEVDTLPELSFAMNQSPLVLDVTAELIGGRTIRYRTIIPDPETAVIVKAHSWNNRRAAKDLADLHSLLEIRQEHPKTSWSLNDPQRGFRRAAARILQKLGEQLPRQRTGFELPASLDRMRLAGLIAKHVR